jgi:hypothetical protein
VVAPDQPWILLLRHERHRPALAPLAQGQLVIDTAAASTPHRRLVLQQPL